MTDHPRRRPADRRLVETRKVTYVRPDGNATKIIVSVGYEAADPIRPVEVFYSGSFAGECEILR